MSKYVVKPLTSIYLDPIGGINDLKRDLLLYDKVGILNLDSLLSGLHQYKHINFWQNALNEVEYLIHAEKMVELKSIIKPGNISIDGQNRDLADYTMKLKEKMDSTDKEEEEKHLNLFREHDILNTRFWCGIANSSNDSIFAIPSLKDFSSFNLPNTTKQKAYSIIQKQIPLPIDNTPWEQIFDFNNDSESRLKLLALRNWINELPTEIKQEELEDKIEHLIHQYTENLKRHKISSNLAIIKTIVNVIPKAVTELIRLKPDKAIDAFFSVAEQKVNFQNFKQKSELTGHELAYLTHVNSSFKK